MVGAFRGLVPATRRVSPKEPRQMKPNSDRNYTFPINLVPNKLEKCPKIYIRFGSTKFRNSFPIPDTKKKFPSYTTIFISIIII